MKHQSTDPRRTSRTSGGNKKVYSEISEEPVPELPPMKKVIAGIKSRQYTPKPERELDIPGPKVIEPFSDRFTVAVDYRNYRLLKTSSRYDNNVRHKL